MSAQFCRIGKKKVDLKQLLGLKELEKKYKSFIEEAYNVKSTDASLSDVLYYEARKIKQLIINSKHCDVTF
ncbi:Lacal_2735 family protein [Bizionia argentinensis JUB59]|uniref:Lacal_2735 family protein n=1 Tax=Bizionia argentinensis JUB59 TaxID=1046627 RepID=G2EFZ5_9FLAO|nr:Lacal_2735 family protein [Bizionia argentinensis]EGV42648.1 Lacal_2735 family protein [Bizionia argentinensis JUB59]